MRSHWRIENGLRWVLDLVMEDQARSRKDHGPQNLALPRKLALNLPGSHNARLDVLQRLLPRFFDANYRHDGAN